MGLALAIAAAAATFAGPAPVLTSCAHVPHVTPRSVVLACADANFYVTRLRWSRWDDRVAVGTGLGHQNDCSPYCAAGHFHTYRLELRLSRVVSCIKGRPEFATLRWRFLDARPAHVPRTSSETLPCSFLRLHP